MLRCRRRGLGFMASCGWWSSGAFFLEGGGRVVKASPGFFVFVGSE